jgi:hypothetical protein
MRKYLILNKKFLWFHGGNKTLTCIQFKSMLLIQYFWLKDYKNNFFFENNTKKSKWKYISVFKLSCKKYTFKKM